MRKNISILQEGGLTTVLPRPPVIRVVLLHKQSNRVCNPLFPQVYLNNSRISEENFGAAYTIKSHYSWKTHELVLPPLDFTVM